MIAKDILNYIDDTIESIRIPRKKISKKTVPKMTNNELFTSAAINEQKNQSDHRPKRPTTTLNIAIPIPNIWSRALIADNSETQNDRVDVTSEPLIRSSTNLETSRRSFRIPIQLVEVLRFLNPEHILDTDFNDVYSVFVLVFEYCS